MTMTIRLAGALPLLVAGAAGCDGTAPAAVQVRAQPTRRVDWPL